MERELFDGVRDCLAEVLLLKDPAVVTLSSSLIRDLGADSLDILDLIFHLEERFGIKISKDEINYYSNLGLPPEQTHVDGVLTAEALKGLAAMMPEVDPAVFSPGLKVSEVPKLITVQTLINLVKAKVEARPGLPA
ncbi:MAG: acyl carrier protein [Candidatus Riflebacteria bacterium]|nr:acyl carrier protein [Candidatus Riflebacteria bacterium]